MAPTMYYANIYSMPISYTHDYVVLRIDIYFFLCVKNLTQHDIQDAYLGFLNVMGLDASQGMSGKHNACFLRRLCSPNVILCSFLMIKVSESIS